MKPRLQKWLVRGSIAAVLFLGGVALAGYLSRDFWFRQIRMYLRGQLEVRGEETGPDLPGVDLVEVFALGGRNPEDKQVTFMPGRLSRFTIAGRKTLDLAASQEVARIWRNLARRPGVNTPCHDPGYALRFLSGGELLLETTVCWKCMNYSIPLQFPGLTEEGFVSFQDDKESQALLSLLKVHVPLAAEKAAVAAQPAQP